MKNKEMCFLKQIFYNSVISTYDSLNKVKYDLIGMKFY